VTVFCTAPTVIVLGYHMLPDKSANYSEREHRSPYITVS